MRRRGHKSKSDVVVVEKGTRESSRVDRRNFAVAWLWLLFGVGSILCLPLSLRWRLPAPIAFNAPPELFSEARAMRSLVALTHKTPRRFYGVSSFHLIQDPLEVIPMKELLLNSSRTIFSLLKM